MRSGFRCRAFFSPENGKLGFVGNTCFCKELPDMNLNHFFAEVELLRNFIIGKAVVMVVFFMLNLTLQANIISSLGSPKKRLCDSTAMGQATLETTGQTGVGVLHFPDYRAYVFLVTFQKTDKEFSPSTMYADYPISRELLHWESQSGTPQNSETGKNLINHAEREYTILFFARDKKQRNDTTMPYTYLGPAAELTRYESERPIKMTWRLKFPMPVEMFEENRKGG